MICFFKVILLVIFTISQPLLSKESTATPEVVGHKPVAKNVRIDKADAKLGDTLTVLYDFYDIDDDLEAISKIQWFYNGTPQSLSSWKYTPKLHTTGTYNECNDFQVTVSVMPVSDSGDPSVGEPTLSYPVIVKLPIISGYLRPIGWTGQKHAEQLCANKGMRLPKRSELEALFSHYTTMVPSMEFAEKYGWPLGALCGANGRTQYWTSEGDGIGNYYSVNLTTGSVQKEQESASNLFTCI